MIVNCNTYNFSYWKIINQFLLFLRFFKQPLSVKNKYFRLCVFLYIFDYWYLIENSRKENPIKNKEKTHEIFFTTNLNEKIWGINSGYFVKRLR